MQSFFIRSSLKSLSVLLASLQALTLHRHSLGTFVTRRLEHDVPPKMASIVHGTWTLPIVHWGCPISVNPTGLRLSVDEQ